VPVRRLDSGTVRSGMDTVAVEEPLEIRVGTVGTSDESIAPLAVTMRTPGHDFELTMGFVVTEGIATDAAAIHSVAYCGLPPDEQEYNVVVVRLRGTVDLDRHRRNVYTTSSCGVCGKASIEAVEVACPHPPRLGTVDTAVVTGLPDQLRGRQRLFDETGGVHAAGLSSVSGELAVVREDVGRHNAVDKVVGWAAMHGRLPLDDTLLVVSGRASFEIVQKAAVAGIGMIVAVSAPSSLAVSAADRLGVTLVAFTREGRATVYTHPDRVAHNGNGNGNG